MSYANKPIYLFGGTGILLIIISLLSLLFLVIRKYTVGIVVLSSPIFVLSIILFILGFQSILLGMIAELLVRTYHESTNKSTYSIKKLINLQQNKEG